MHKNGLIAVAVGMFIAFFSTIIYAGTSAQQVMKMNEPSYATHQKGIVEFTHKKHAREYNISCGKCHHDNKGNPLALKKGDAVQRCIECHKIPAPMPKGDDAPKLSKKEALQYHAVALHLNCKGCHQAHNKKHNTTDAPTECIQCHPENN